MLRSKSSIQQDIFFEKKIVAFTCSKDDIALRKLMHKSLKSANIEILCLWMLEEYNILISTL